MSALSPGPAPGHVTDFITWEFVAAVFAAWVVVEIGRFALRWRAESRRIDAAVAAMDEASRRAARTGRWVV